MKDLSKIISENFTQASDFLYITDRGPDYSMASLLSYYAMGKLWMQSNLVTLAQTSFAAHNSAFNPIERAWSWITKLLAYHIPPVALTPDGKPDPHGVPPLLNRKLSHEQRIEEEVKLMNFNTKQLAEMFKGQDYNGYPIVADFACCPVRSSSIPCFLFCCLTSISSVLVLRKRNLPRTYSGGFTT